MFMRENNVLWNNAITLQIINQFCFGPATRINNYTLIPLIPVKQQITIRCDGEIDKCLYS